SERVNSSSECAIAPRRSSSSADGSDAGPLALQALAAGVDASANAVDNADAITIADGDVDTLFSSATVVVPVVMAAAAEASSSCFSEESDEEEEEEEEDRGEIASYRVLPSRASVSRGSPPRGSLSAAVVVVATPADGFALARHAGGDDDIADGSGAEKEKTVALASAAAPSTASTTAAASAAAAAASATAAAAASATATAATATAATATAAAVAAAAATGVTTNPKREPERVPSPESEQREPRAGAKATSTTARGLSNNTSGEKTSPPSVLAWNRRSTRSARATGGRELAWNGGGF
ncbi:unnamed protein product, partial [Laminaria digitata]